MAFRIARIVRAPTLVSGLSSQRRVVGACPIPTAATLPRCFQIPRSCCVRYIAAGTIWVVINLPFCNRCDRGLAGDLPLGNLLPSSRRYFEDQLHWSADWNFVYWRAGEVREHVYPGGVIQVDHGDVVRLIPLQLRYGRVVYNSVT